MFLKGAARDKGYREAISLMRLKVGTKQVAQPVSAYREEIGAARLKKDRFI